MSDEAAGRPTMPGVVRAHDVVRNLVLTVDAGDLELAADELWGWGAVAIEERTTHDGRVELWTALGDEDDDLVALVATLPTHWPHRFADVDASVSETWRAFARPTRITESLVCVPAWVAYEAPVGEEVLLVEPGATFGLGDHPTTVLTMRAMLAELSARTPGEPTVLDVGCGSGVLAVAACRFGAARAVAIDISPASPAVTRVNAELNGVGERITASCTPLPEITGRYDLVLANILAPTLIELADDLRRVTAPGGVLILSGLLDGHYDHVIAALGEHELSAIDRLDGWVALTIR